MKNFQFKIQQEVLDLVVKIKGVRIHGVNAYKITKCSIYQNTRRISWTY